MEREEAKKQRGEEPKIQKCKEGKHEELNILDTNLVKDFPVCNLKLSKHSLHTRKYVTRILIKLFALSLRYSSWQADNALHVTELWSEMTMLFR